METAGTDPLLSAPFFNRELSWIDFNERVLEEGLRRDRPPLDRLKYLSIAANNFDEFFMVRAAAVKRALKAGGETAGPGAMAPRELLLRTAEKARSIYRRLYDCLRSEIFPALARGGLVFSRPESLEAPGRSYLESFFRREILPVLTPLKLEPEGPLPHIESVRLHAAFFLVPEGDAPEAAGTAAAVPAAVSIVCIPRVLDRVIRLPEHLPSHDFPVGPAPWVLLEDMVLAWGSYLFPGYRIKEKMLFKLNRDADFSVDEKRDEDFVEAMEEALEGRGFSMPVRMAYSPGSGSPEGRRLRDELARRLGLGEEDLYEIDGPFNLNRLYEIIIRDYSPPGLPAGAGSLREKPWKIYPHPAFKEDEPLWDRLSQGDVLLHLPYQSFDPVVRFFQEAASDPHVLCIKTALYRTSTGGSSTPAIIRALEQAALAGKHVTAVVELKARFDEERNISWAHKLERAGVIVVYGLAHLKVHAKVTLVMRRENERIKRYVHLSTGNYNDVTAKVYEDLSLFTAREDIAYDAGLLFNMITGYSSCLSMRRLVIAPTGLKRRLLELIDREIKRSRPEAPGRIMAKLNALADGDIINALYRASAGGVKVFLNVRGICMLVPGLPGLSENIRVVSVIDHNLEHSRIYSFGSSGSEEVYLSSADWMPRNLERRVELMFPVLEEDTRQEVKEILAAYFRDNCQAWLLHAGGEWTRLSPGPGEEPYRVQERLLAMTAKEAERPDSPRTDFTVRRTPL